MIAPDRHDNVGNRRSLLAGALLFVAMVVGSHATPALAMTCSAVCPDGSMSEPVDCDDPNDVPMCLRQPASSSSGSSRSSGSTPSYSGPSPGQIFGEALVNGIKEGLEQQRQRRAQEQLEEMERERLRQEQKAEQQRQFEAQKNALLDATTDNRAATPQAADTSAQWNWLMRMHQREMGLRQSALEKLKGSPDETWCKLNLVHVRLPTPPLDDVGNQYPAMVDQYLAARGTWDARCGGPSARAGYHDNDRDLLALKPPANPPATPAAPAAPAARPEPVTDSSVVDLSGVSSHAVVAPLSTGPAPVVPNSWGTPEEVHLALSSTAAPAIPDAAAYMRKVGDFLSGQVIDKGRDVLSDAASAQLGLTGTVLLNETKLPALVLPQIEAASRGDLSTGDADRLLPQAVNTLFNTGSLGNEIVNRATPTAGVALWSATQSAATSAQPQIANVLDMPANVTTAALQGNTLAKTAARWISGDGAR